jgi:integrase family protein with SAM-like domain
LGTTGDNFEVEANPNSLRLRLAEGYILTEFGVPIDFWYRLADLGRTRRAALCGCQPNPRRGHGHVHVSSDVLRAETCGDRNSSSGWAGKGGRQVRQTGDQWLSQFMDYLAGERGYSQHTIRNYAADLDLFNASLAKDLLGALLMTSANLF